MILTKENNNVYDIFAQSKIVVQISDFGFQISKIQI